MIINWSTTSIHPGGVFVTRAVLSLPSLLQLQFSQSPPEDIDLLAVHGAHHGLKQVFSKNISHFFPPHRPTRKLYNLSKPEEEVMETYIRESLAVGLIRPSSSPVGAGFFFVEKDKTLSSCIDQRSELNYG